MTQAFNLAQLANNLNTSGQLDASDGFYGAMPIANGGTGQTSASSAIDGLLPSQSGNSGKLLSSNGTATLWSLLSQRIIQVVSTPKYDTFTTTSQSWVDITGMEVTITPTSSSNKMLLIAQCNLGVSGTGDTFIKFAGGNSGVYIGNAAGNRRQVAGASGNDYDTQYNFSNTIVYLDSPATSSAITYKIQMLAGTGQGAHLNRDGEDPDSIEGWRGASSITVLEVQA